MPVLGEIKGNVPVKLWLPVEEAESGALTQLRNVANLPWTFHHVAAMPDCHFGKGATIGSVIAMKGAVAPSAVGVDIGCGMSAARTNLTAADLPDSLAEVRHQIERDVPTGYNEHKESPGEGVRIASDLRERVRLHLEGFKTLTRVPGKDLEKHAWQQIGTLGGGNHFIEMCLDTEQRIWIVLHSGSRYTGNKLAEAHINHAMALDHNKGLPDRALSVFLAGTAEYTAYWHDLQWAQVYAALNRDVMLDLIYGGLRRKFFRTLAFEEVIRCHHNYAEVEEHFGEQVVVTRKGAIRAGVGQMGVIPGSMGGKSFIVRGRGEAEAYSSAAHGAGRRMSRGEARRTFNADDVAAQTVGVECRKDKGVVDEIPSAYKDIDVVMSHQADLVETVTTLKGILVVKDSKGD
jgi:tRNA-splicing ligase RtcB (3'-phosphate/5'-hydroxy nucleic acid ligase)